LGQAVSLGGSLNFINLSQRVTKSMAIAAIAEKN
jgi:hypothetical protein